MGSEDFKSFAGHSRVRGGFDSHTFPPSGRSFLRPGLVFLFSGIAVLLLASSLMADDRSPRIDRSDLPDSSTTTPAAFVGLRPGFTLGETPDLKHPPLRSVLFSAVVPGLGQADNGRWAKASAFIAIGALLVSRIAVESDRSDRYLHLSRDASTEEESRAYYDRYSTHFDRRDRYVWWAAVFWAYGLFDAYVDGHLFGFSRQ